MACGQPLRHSPPQGCFSGCSVRPAWELPVLARSKLGSWSWVNEVDTLMAESGDVERSKGWRPSPSPEDHWLTGGPAEAGCAGGPSRCPSLHARTWSGVRGSDGRFGQRAWLTGGALAKSLRHWKARVPRLLRWQAEPGEVPVLPLLSQQSARHLQPLPPPTCWARASSWKPGACTTGSTARFRQCAAAACRCRCGRSRQFPRRSGRGSPPRRRPAQTATPAPSRILS